MPVYPLLITAALILTLFTDSIAAMEALPRPLLVALLVALGIQLVCSALIRNRHWGAAVAAEVILLVGTPVLALVAAVGSAAILLWLARRGQRIRELRLHTATRFLNVVSAITLVATAASAINVGAFELHGIPARAGGSGTGLPDIYVILLDGHPRADTIESQFGVTIEPFIDDMRSLGFTVAARSHSNYNLTSLTIATMLNMAQVQSLMPDPPTDARRQHRVLSGLINNAAGLELLRSEGYEIVSIPSPFTNVTLYGADRLLDRGNLTDFDLSVLQTGGIPELLPDFQREWVSSDLRARALRTFETLGSLAVERADKPRFIFAHVMSPHPPTLFAADGSAQAPWPCFPRHCAVWDRGERYGDAIVAPTIEQIDWLDEVVYETTATIVTSSRTPPVIIVLSDHGLRHDEDDRSETLRSLFMSFTPGHPNLFPGDTTPINTLPRVLNAYAGTNLPLASEESYWLDIRFAPKGDMFNLVPWNP